MRRAERRSGKSASPCSKDNDVIFRCLAVMVSAALLAPPAVAADRTALRFVKAVIAGAADDPRKVWYVG